MVSLSVNEKYSAGSDSKYSWVEMGQDRNLFLSFFSLLFLEIRVADRV
jgi:hypothetical protein